MQINAKLLVPLGTIFLVAGFFYYRSTDWATAAIAPVQARRPELATPADRPIHSSPAEPAAMAPVSIPTASRRDSTFVRARLEDVFPGAPRDLRDWREFRPERMLVAPLSGRSIAFVRSAVKDDGRLVTWIGRNAAVPGASFVSVARESGFDAVLIIPGASQFSFHVRGDSVVIDESAPGEEGCGVDPAQLDRPSPAAASPALYRAARVSAEAADDPVAESNSVVNAPNVDVLFLYDADSLNYATARSTDPIGYLEGRSRATLESGNLVLAQSGVTAFVWRWIGLEASPPYTRTGILIDDLRQVSPGGAIGDFVSGLRYRYGADQVMLLIGGATDAGGWANIATKQVPVSGTFACTVMRVSGSYKLMAHELAHNFGCRHDRANFGGTGVATPEGDGYWCYGLLWTDPPGAGGTTTSGTVMSYANYIVPYFSNPAITLEVTTSMEERSGPNVSLGTQTIGYPESHAKAAYNARVLNDNASAIVTVNAELAPPRIVTQPQGAVLAIGRALSLSVVAEGGGLFYQWFRNGQAIADATTANYAKASISSADAGDYSVQITNRLGAVTSSTATVSLTAVPDTPSPPAGGAGGGGGGAPAGPFAVLATLLLGLRRVRRLATE